MKLHIPALVLGSDYLSLEVCVPVMFGWGSSKELPNLALFASIKVACLFREFAFHVMFFFSPYVAEEVMPLACRLCLGTFSASPCSVIMENWRHFILLQVGFLMDIWINLVHLELGRFRQAPKGSGWKYFQSIRPS